MSARRLAVVPAAGSGSRFGQATPKQYTLLAGQPLLAHTLAVLCAEPRIDQVWVVISPDDDWFEPFGFAQQAWAQSKLRVLRQGGATRAESVRNGLAALDAQPDDWVLVHDAARCLVTPEQIDALIDACAHDSVGGLLAHKLADTLKTATAGPGGVRVASTVDRSDKWLAQTPQMFRIGALMAALEHVGSAVTDEASAMEAMGLHPRLVAGSALNFKVTYPEDFALAQAVLAQRGHGATLERFGGVRLHTDPAKEQDT